MLNFLLRSGKRTNSLHLRHPRDWFSMLEWFFFFLLEFITRMCGFVFKIWNSENCLISVIQKQFWYVSTQTILNVLKKSFKSLKASLEVRKLSFLLDSNNSNSVWEWKKPLTPKVFSWIDRAQGFFFFFSKYYIAYLLFILSFKNCVSIGMELKVNLESFETTRIG